MKIRINGKLYICDNALEQITLFKQISDELDRLKNKKEKNPVISKKSVTIGNEKNINKEFINQKPKVTENKIEVTLKEPTKQILTATFSKGIYEVSSAKRENDINSEYDMHAARDIMEKITEPKIENPKKKERKITNYETYYELKKERGIIPIISYDILTKEELAELKNSSLIFVSGTLNHKIETGYYENAEILKGLPTAPFITGKAINPEKILKESSKLIKLARQTSTDIVCYEANNDELRETKDDKLFKAFDAIIGLSEVLKEAGYKPLICLDSDIRKKLRKLEPNYKISTPIISRVSSKELDNLSIDADILAMNSKSHYDELMLTNHTKHYLMDNKNIKTPSR